MEGVAASVPPPSSAALALALSSQLRPTRLCPVNNLLWDYLREAATSRDARYTFQFPLGNSGDVRASTMGQPVGSAEGFNPRRARLKAGPGTVGGSTGPAGSSQALA